MNESLPARLSCPRCHAAAFRVQRTFGDRCLSVFVPLARYRCSIYCGWEGLVRRSGPDPGDFRRSGG